MSSDPLFKDDPFGLASMAYKLGHANGSLFVTRVHLRALLEAKGKMTKLPKVARIVVQQCVDDIDRTLERSKA